MADEMDPFDVSALDIGAPPYASPTLLPYPLANAVLATFRAKGLKIATAESCTGGLVAGCLTEIAGSSDVVDRGFVTYSNSAKMQMLGVSAASLEAHGAVSEEVAREMAEGALANSEADVAVSITGIAGPGGSEHKPEGRVCFGLAKAAQPTHVETVDWGALGRDKVRALSVGKALELALLTAMSPEERARYNR